MVDLSIKLMGISAGYTVMDILYITHHNYRAVSEHEMGNLTPKMAILIRQPMIYQFTNEFWDKYFFSDKP